jgi:hypothetical protein
MGEVLTSTRRSALVGSDAARTLVSRIFASWNQLDGLLRLVDHLRVAA